MQYLGENIPKLGFGMMRLPKNKDGIDIEQVKAMVDRFLASGFTYFDTAYGYPGSEVAVNQALVDRHTRESYQLATKLPAWAGAKTAAEAKAMFTTSLSRTGAGYFDFYLLHNLGGNRTKCFDDYGIWEYAAELKANGLVRHIGFSFHDTADVLDSILTAHPEVEFVQLQINYADWNSPSVQSRMCYETAMKHNKPIIIMEPVKGGTLAAPPKSVAEIIRSVNPTASYSSFALRYAASLENLITVLSGMSDMSQLEDNISTFAAFRPLDTAERDAAARAQEALASVPTIPCTSCKYCIKDCPAGVPIPGIFRAVNKYLVYENKKSSTDSYKRETRSGVNASACVGCGQCESVCPQHISVIAELNKAAELFEK